VGPNHFAANYAFAHENGILLTNSMIAHLYNNKIPLNKENPHNGVNQFHFDTFKLNTYLTRVAKSRGIKFIDDEVSSINRDSENGFIESINLSSGISVSADFFIDASGFSRVLMSKLVDDEKDFESYRKYLPCDSAAVFQTPLDESGEIRPYTRARAMPSGWMWEIPTQERRGNGYVFASDFCSDEQAVKDISFKKESSSVVKHYNIQFNSLMENIVTMVALHYISDRNDTEMWREQQNLDKPELLKYLLEIWSERCPEMYDYPLFGYELFHSAHLWHVAQGQGVIPRDVATEQLNSFGSRNPAAKIMADKKFEALKLRLVDHASIFKKA